MENLLQPVTVTVRKGRPTTTSQNIALVFGKPHKVVLNAIRQIIADLPDENNRHNFMPTYYRDAQGRRQPSYRLTRDGFTLLAMGFTGKTALQFKIAYIDAFNKMEAELAQRAQAKTPALPSPQSKSEILRNKITNQLELLLPISRYLDAATTDAERIDRMKDAIDMATLAYKLGPNLFQAKVER